MYVRDAQGLTLGLTFRGGARVVSPAVPDELRVTVADRADHELVAALQYGGDALHGVRLHDGACVFALVRSAHLSRHRRRAYF